MFVLLSIHTVDLPRIIDFILLTQMGLSVGSW